MTKRERNDLYFVCSLIEFIGRYTKNRNRDVVKFIGKKELLRQLKAAEVNHCFTFEEVADDLIKYAKIENGAFDPVAACKYKVPSETSIGKVYCDLVLDVKRPSDEVVDVMHDVFVSFISDEISNFNSSAYYENPSYLMHSYLAGYMLD